MTGQIGSRDHRDGVLPEAEHQPISSTPWSRAPSALLGNFDFILSSLFLLVPLYLFNPPPQSSLPYYLQRFSSLDRLSLYYLSSFFLYSQNVCSCCFLRHRQGGQRRMVFPSQLCVIYTTRPDQPLQQQNTVWRKKESQMLIVRVSIASQQGLLPR